MTTLHAQDCTSTCCANLQLAPSFTALWMSPTQDPERGSQAPVQKYSSVCTLGTEVSTSPDAQTFALKVVGSASTLNQSIVRWHGRYEVWP